MHKAIFTFMAVSFVTAFLVAYYKPGPIKQDTPLRVIDGTSIGATPSFTHGSNPYVNIGGYSAVTVDVEYTYQACTEICMQCYSLQDGNAARFTMQALAGTGVVLSVYQLDSGDAKICKAVSADADWAWTISVNQQYLDCDFSGTDCNTDDVVDVYVTAGAL